jgi:hypothetical protein
MEGAEMTPTPQEAMRQEFEASDLSAFRQGNWPHPDGIGRIVGWIIPNEAVERMGADAYCLPREIDEALTRLAALRAQPEAVQDEWLEKAESRVTFYTLVLVEWLTARCARDPKEAEYKQRATDAKRELLAHLSARLLPPQGWQMVPRDADENMERAFRLTYERASAGGRRTLHFRDAYQAALAAAPSKEK